MPKYMKHKREEYLNRNKIVTTIECTVYMVSVQSRR